MLPNTSKFLKRNLLLWTAAGLIAIVSPWGIQESLGAPGDSCEQNPFTCDVCNQEICVNNPEAGEDQCQNGNGSFDPNDEPTPTCPNSVRFQVDAPDCWTSCTEEVIENEEFPQCAPDDTFCEGISGGNEASDCRSATCTDEEIPVLANPSGCDFEFDGSDEEICILCANPQPANFDACGNGICEQPGETFENCEIDCRVPGFNGDKLDEGDATLDDACVDPVQVIELTRAFAFNPNNDPRSDFCEDGDVCTENLCDTQGACNVTPKICSLDESDLCCPAGCEAPPSGDTCANDTGCDVDCFIPVDCTPPPPPPSVVELSGSGCSLNPQVDGEKGNGFFMVSLLGIGAGLFFSFRKRSASQA